MWKLLAVLGISLLLFEACSRKTPVPQSSCHFVMSSDQQRVSWHGNIPVRMTIDSNTVPANYVPAIKQAMQVWNDELGVKVFTDPNYAPIPDHRSEDGVLGIYFIGKDWFGNSQEQARTSLYYSGDLIYEADIRVNTEDFTYSLADTIDSPKQVVDFKSLLIHETGHVLGLAHDDGQPSVMNKMLPFDELRVHLYQVDKDSAHCEY